MVEIAEIVAAAAEGIVVEVPAVAVVREAGRSWSSWRWWRRSRQSLEQQLVISK